MLRKLAMLAAGASSLMAMHIAEININEHDVETQLRLDMGQFNTMIEPDTTFFGFRYLHGSDEHSKTFKSGDRVNGFGEINFLIRRALGKEKLFSFGMGVKALRTYITGKDFTALPLGIELGLRIPGTKAVPVTLGSAFYYSPQVLSLDDAKNYIEARASVDVALIPRGIITAGYRHIDTNYQQGDVEYNHAAYFGFKFLF